MIKRAIHAAAIAALTALGIAGAQAEPLAIHIGWATTPSHIQPLIDELQKRHPEIFVQFGKAGELEIAAFSPSALALAIVNAHLDVRIVADCLQDGIDGHFSVPYVVRADGPIKTIEDTKGKRVASNTVGSSNDAAMRVMLHRHGVQDSDFVTVQANFSNMPAMIESDKVDLIPVMLEFNRPLVKSGKYRVLFTQMDAVGPAQTVLWEMQPDFIKQHRDVLVDFFADHLRAVRWFLDPAHQHEIDEMVALGVVPQRIAAEPDYTDLSLIKEAKARLDGK